MLSRLIKPRVLIIIPLTVILGIAVACGADATPVPPTPIDLGAISSEIQKAIADAAENAPKPLTESQIEAIVMASLPTAAPIPDAEKTASKVVIALSTPLVETNLTWSGAKQLMVQHDPIIEYLVDVDPDTGTFTPQLAESWSVSTDGLAWTFKLRSDVPFHYGFGNFTAKDVVKSWEIMTQEKSLASDLRSFRNVESVEIVDNETATLHLTDADPNLAFVLASSSALAMQSSAQWAEEGEAGIALRLAGTGPYQQGERKLGQSMSFERAPGEHWRVTPDFDEIEMRWAPEEATRLAALMAGEAHITTLSRELGDQSEGNGMRVIKAGFPSTQTSILLGGLVYLSPDKVDLSLPWVKDKRVRQAMSKALNRTEINDTIFKGKGEPMTVAGYHPTLSGYNPDWDARFQEVYGYDLPKAKQLMADAGFADGFKIDGFVHVWPGVEEIPQLMEAVGIAWKELGIELSLEEVDFSALRPLYVGRTLKQAFVGTPGWRPTEVNIRVLNLVNGVIHMYEDQGLEDRYAQLLDTVDPTDRERLQREMGDIKFDAIELLPLFWLTRQVSVNPRVVSGWIFPGLDAGGLGHFELIKAAN